MSPTDITRSAASVAVAISSLATPPDALAFRVTNAEWISTVLATTDEDRRVPNNPLTQIVALGTTLWQAQSR